MAFLGVNTTDGTTIPTVTDYSAGTFTKGALTYVTSGTTQGVWLATYDSSNVAPALGSQVWQQYFGPCWTSTKTLTTNHLRTFTHDKFTGSVFHIDATSTTAAKLYVQQSGDGVAWDVSTEYTTATVTGGADQTIGAPLTGFGIKFTEEILLPYIRLKFVYGTNKPNTLRLFGRCANSGVKYQVNHGS